MYPGEAKVEVKMNLEGTYWYWFLPLQNNSKVKIFPLSVEILWVQRDLIRLPTLIPMTVLTQSHKSLWLLHEKIWSHPCVPTLVSFGRTTEMSHANSWCCCTPIRAFTLIRDAWRVSRLTCQNLVPDVHSVRFWTLHVDSWLSTFVEPCACAQRLRTLTRIKYVWYLGS